ncbi:MAG: hypothetical protein L0Z50_18460 [Verrucomicrobiales bacterium]|nr:hypothetical protein [Verrucomicrobiales bacterium]
MSRRSRDYVRITVTIYVPGSGHGKAQASTAFGREIPRNRARWETFARSREKKQCATTRKALRRVVRCTYHYVVKTISINVSNALDLMPKQSSFNLAWVIPRVSLVQSRARAVVQPSASMPVWSDVVSADNHVAKTVTVHVTCSCNRVTEAGARLRCIHDLDHSFEALAEPGAKGGEKEWGERELWGKPSGLHIV